MASSKDQETAQLSAKDCHFLQEILHQLLSSGAKVDWVAIAKACDYKTGPSAYMGFTRIKKKLGWPSEAANQEKAGTSGKAGTKRGATTVKKEKVENGDDVKREAGEEDGSVKKRQKRDPVKKEEEVFGEDIAQEYAEGFVQGPGI